MSQFHSYSPADGHGLKHNPFKALIAPRPIGWISSVSKTGEGNLAPYSFFNAFSDNPPIIGFSSTGRKDSLRNIEETGCFVHNVASRVLLEQLVATSAGLERGIDELELVGLTAIASDIVSAPRVAEAPASLECKLIEIKHLQTAEGAMTNDYLVIGEVVRIHINTAYLKDGMVDEAELKLAARLGYLNYTMVSAPFALQRPTT